MSFFLKTLSLIPLMGSIFFFGLVFLTDFLPTTLEILSLILGIIMLLTFMFMHIVFALGEI